MGYALAKVESVYSRSRSRFLAGHTTLTSDNSAPGEVVYLVENDAAARRRMCEQLESMSFSCISFCSLEDYDNHVRSDGSACLILNLQVLADSRGSLNHLHAVNLPPAIFVTGLCDTPAIVSAMKAGAVEVLSFPLELPRFEAAIREAFTRDIKERQEYKERLELKQKLSLLTPREREVLPLVAAGLLNKQAASVLGISQVTLQIHRGQIMRKMVAASFAELVLMAASLGLHCPTSALDLYIVRPRAYGT
jgi:FixJ family two-component response regulator